jgi:hypothetical protein
LRASWPDPHGGVRDAGARLLPRTILPFETHRQDRVLKNLRHGLLGRNVS